MNKIKLYIILLTLCNRILISRVLSNKTTFAYINGNFIIGALFPLHHQPSSKKNHFANSGIKCGEIRELYGIQRVEATLKTLDEINNNPKLLPNISLGVEIRDECWYAPVALQQSIELIRDQITPVGNFKKYCSNTDEENKKLKNEEKKGPLIGIIGPGASSVALQVQNLLQLFHIPQIGYSATSRDLSDKSRFNYFLRVVPSDYYQAQVMLDIVRYFGWSYVSVVNTDGNYGQSGIQAFRELAEEAEICIAREDSVLSNAPDEFFDKVVLNLKQDSKALVVICFCEGFTVRGLLNATKRLNMTNYFLFIGSDGWADRNDVTENLEKEALGGLSIRIHSPYVQSFDKYYWSLKPNTNIRNPWFKEFWQTKFKCIFKEDHQIDFGASSVHQKINFCTGNESLRDHYKQDPKLSFVIKAIYAYAHALHDMICKSELICDKILPFNGSLLKSYLLNVSFEFDKEIFKFDEIGDPHGRYDIMNFQKLRDGSFEYVQVGTWYNKSLAWWKIPRFPKIRARNTIQSVCAEECPQGFYKNVQQGGKDNRCCWVCVPCSIGEILTPDGEKCEKCPKGYAPNVQKTLCQIVPIQYVQWNDRSAIIAMIFSIFGLLTTLFALSIFLKFNHTPVVKSSTKELCYLILFGMTLAHLSVFAMIAKPTSYSCSLTRLLPGISFSMIYSALLTKTNRISRILVGSKKKFPSRKFLFMSATAQIFIAMSLIGIEILIAGFILYLQPPVVAFNYFPAKTQLECDISLEAIVAPLLFDFILIILCTVYAIKTRNVPENFNEAKFIGFAMYTTCVIWIAFVPIYFGSGAKVITMCICVTLSALVTWVFLFVPKLYIILLKPEKNNRAVFTTTAIRCHIGAKVASTLKAKYSNNSWTTNSSISGINNDSENKAASSVSKRTLSCQTGQELLEILLRPKRLMQEDFSAIRNDSLKSVKIIERNCYCNDSTCQIKHILILLPKK